MKLQKMKLVLILIISFVALAGARGADIYPWLKNLETARALATKEQLPHSRSHA